MVKNIKLTIAYDGTNYFGWQKQVNVETIQDKIEDAIRLITSEEVNLTASGRTDSGVHAIAQVANFFTNTNIPKENIKLALNSKLNSDIRILKAEEVDENFNSRFNAKRKTYVYKIYNDKIMMPFYERYAWHVPYGLKLCLMEQVLDIICGEHDFRAFMSTNSSVNSTVRKIFETNLTKNDNLIEISVTGNGFLYNMVRIIVGTAVGVGAGKIEISNVERAMIDGNRNLLGKTAPAKGLFLESVEYF